MFVFVETIDVLNKEIFNRKHSDCSEDGYVNILVDTELLNAAQVVPANRNIFWTGIFGSKAIETSVKTVLRVDGYQEARMDIISVGILKDFEGVDSIQNVAVLKEEVQPSI